MSSTSFADAQRRLAERRQAREAATAAAASSATKPRPSRLPFPFNRAWNAINGADGVRPAFRVGQVDAELLDEELLDVLKGQVGEALKYFAGGHLKEDWSDEILLVLRAVLFKLSIWDHDASYGAALQNLKYTDSRRDGPVLVPPTRAQKVLYGLVTVLGKYGWTKWENWLIEQNDGYNERTAKVRLLSRLTSVLSTAHSAAALASFLVFLLHGRYRTLLDRILKLRLAPPTSQVSREVSFEYQNRQLVWHAFTEFLLFVLPLIGINKWRRWLSRTWRKTKGVVKGSEPDKSKGEYSFLPERTCAICYQDQNAAASTESEIMAAAASGGVVGSAQTDITNPYETIPCGCIYCFVCIATRLEKEEGEGWTCLRCGELVKECKPWSGDVVDPPKPGGKTVAFSEEVKGVVYVEPDETPQQEEPAEPEVEGEEVGDEGRGDSSSASSVNSDEGFEEARDMIDEEDME